MRLLDIFPIPRRYERIPGTLAFTLTAAMAVLCCYERTVWAVGLLAGSVVLLALVYAVRVRQKKEWERFFRQENTRLLKMKGAAGPGWYIPEQRKVLAGLRHPELRITARLNLAAALLANADPEGALEQLSALDPAKMPNPTLQLVYWTQALGAYMQQKDAGQAEAAYEQAMAILPEVSDMLKVSFMPTEIQYRLFHGEYQLALDQLGQIPEKDLDEASRDLLSALRAAAVRGLGRQDEADRLAAQVRKHDLLPSTRALLAK